MGLLRQAAPRQLARGCRDVLPSIASVRRRLIMQFARLAELHGCREIETPVLEPASLFSSLGPTSDVNTCETYYVSGTDPALVLRPEGTAGVARAVSESALRYGARHGVRLWYAGPMFRHERPQAGRFRQFTQLGVELIDSESGAENERSTAMSIDTDIDVIELAHLFLTQAGLNVRLRLNTLGTAPERVAYNAALKEFLTPSYSVLSEAGRARFDSGECLRIADSRRPADLHALKGAPRLFDFIGLPGRSQFDSICSALRDMNIDFSVDDTLVRGLDYYTATAFEFDAPGALGERAVCAGGRYTGLAGSVTGVGFALGLERVEALLSQAELVEKHGPGGVLVVALTEDVSPLSAICVAARKVVRQLRATNLPAYVQIKHGRIGKTLKQAVKDGFDVVVVIGDREIKDDTVQVKLLSYEYLNAFSTPSALPRSDLVQYLTEQLQKKINLDGSNEMNGSI